MVVQGKSAVAVDIGGTTFSVAVVNERGEMAALEEEETRASEGAEAVLGRIVSTIRRVMSNGCMTNSDVVGIGMGIPGLHDRHQGVVLTSPNLKWENVPVRQWIGTAIGTEVYMDGDVRVAAIGEKYFGAAGGCDNFVFITLGTGIGSGVFIDGELYRGPGGYAGEVGHQTIVENGPLCGCGNYGCVETLAGNGGIVRRAIEALEKEEAPLLLQEVGGEPANITPAALYRAAQAGCSVSRRVLSDTGYYVGTAMANLVNVLNPERIIVGGGVAQAGEMILGPMRETIRKRAMRPNAGMVRVIPAQLGRNAGLLGAAAMVLYRLG